MHCLSFPCFGSELPVRKPQCAGTHGKQSPESALFWEEKARLNKPLPMSGIYSTIDLSALFFSLH